MSIALNNITMSFYKRTDHKISKNAFQNSMKLFTHPEGVDTLRKITHLQINILILICLNITTSYSQSSKDHTINYIGVEKIKGLCWIGRDSIVSDNFNGALDISANWISQTAYGWMNAHDQPQVTTDNDLYWWGEQDRGILHTARIAKQRGLKTLLKPHIRLPRASGKWREDIKMKSREGWSKWFDNYEQWIMHYARLAEEGEMDALCIGTELYKATSKHPERWVSIIKKIRTVYGGKLIYAANWYKEFEKITFWDELDYIGVQGYFPIGKYRRTSKEGYNKSWDKYKKSLSRIYNKYKKPIVFTEIGYTNHMSAASKPWEWPQDIKSKKKESYTTQKICYESFFESLWNEEWFFGTFIWEWHHPTYKEESLAKYLDNRSKRLSLWQEQTTHEFNPNLTFSPQQGPALNVIKDWFSKPFKI